MKTRLVNNALLTAKFANQFKNASYAMKNIIYYLMDNAIVALQNAINAKIILGEAAQILCLAL